MFTQNTVKNKMNQVLLRIKLSFWIQKLLNFVTYFLILILFYGLNVTEALVTDIFFNMQHLTTDT